MKARWIVLLTAVALLPAVTLAQAPAAPESPFSYTYLEFGYTETDYEIAGFDLDGDGFSLSGSFELNDDWHVFAGFGHDELDFNLDLDSWQFGAGYRHPLRDDVDIYGRVMFVNLEADVPGVGSADDDGLGLLGALRATVADNVEVEGGVQYVDIEESDTALFVEGRYYFEELSVGVGLVFGGDSDSIGVSARYTF